MKGLNFSCNHSNHSNRWRAALGVLLHLSLLALDKQSLAANPLAPMRMAREDALVASTQHRRGAILHAGNGWTWYAPSRPTNIPDKFFLLDDLKTSGNRGFVMHDPVLFIHSPKGTRTA